MRSLLIVDDHAGFRAWAREVLALEGFRVIGEAADGAAALDAVAALRPQVLLLDVRLPDMSGFDVARRVAGATTVVLTSSAAAADYGPALARSRGDVAGFVAKADLTGAALRAVLDGSAP